MENINITEEEKSRLKITSLNEYELEFKKVHSKILFYDYKDGDLELCIDNYNDSTNIILNREQVDFLIKFLNQ